MPSPLENLAGPGKPLLAEAPDAAEVAGLLRSGRARLTDAGNAALSLESRFDLAYNAAHAFCLADDLRNLAEYEGHVDVDARLVVDVVAACETVAMAIHGTYEGI